MSEGRSDDSSLSPSRFLRLDEVCNRFEACWTSGQRPRIEDYLGAAEEPDRWELLRELLLLDLEYRIQSGDHPSAAEYQARFPEEAELIEEAFRRMPRTLRQGPGRGDEGSLRIVLEVTGGPHKGRQFEFTGHENFIVGRAPCAHFRLAKEDPYFSRVHFMVEVNPPQCRLVDLVSLNGTSINGRRVEAGNLHHGDLIKGGETVLRVSLVGPGGEATPMGEQDGGREPAGATETFRPAGVPEAGAAPAGEESLAPPPVIAGYEIVRLLGRGGMGTVYLAKQTADGAHLALKVIRPAFAADQREVQRFLRECQILCTLRHPHIVAFHQMGRLRDLFYFAMDYVPGTDARRLVQRHGGLLVARAVRLVCQILGALDYAHGLGFVHRDVKPANLLVSGSEGSEVCRLADFGLARVYHASRMSGLTVLGDVGGTLPYMAPEQITNYRDARPPADQYSAAATLYHLLTGQYPYDFDENRTEQQLMKILVESPVPIRRRRPDVPEQLASVIHRALAKDPGRRFRDAAALREALLPFSVQSSGFRVQHRDRDANGEVLTPDP